MQESECLYVVFPLCLISYSGKMERNDAVAPGDGIQSGQNEIGHFFHGGHSYHNTFRPPRPPPFWGPVLGIPFPGSGSRPPFPPIPPFAYGPPVFSVPPPSIPTCIRPSPFTSKSEDESWLSSWIKTRSLQQCMESSRRQTVSISKVQEELQRCLAILHNLKGLHGNLQANLTSLPEGVWNATWANVETQKAEAVELFRTVLNDEILGAMKNLLKKRIGKRSRQKRQQANLRKDVYLAQLRRQKLHEKADAWLSDMQQAVDRARKVSA